jgi:hypothetical protein
MTRTWWLILTILCLCASVTHAGDARWKAMIVAIVEADDAKLYDGKNGKELMTVPFAAGIFIFEKFLDDGELPRPWHGGGLPHLPLTPRRKIDEWESVVLTDGTRGWMLGKNIAWANLGSVAARPQKLPMTVHLRPKTDGVQTHSLTDAKLARLQGLIDVPSDAAGSNPMLWAWLADIAPGRPTVAGWVPGDKLRFDFVQVQREAARRWARGSKNTHWDGKKAGPGRAIMLLTQMSKDLRGTTYLHPKVWDGGGPRECDAGYQASFDMAYLYVEWEQPEKALAIYKSLRSAKPEAKAYAATVRATAALRRAGLLCILKRYDEALKVYRIVATRHADSYWGNGGMYLPDDRRVLSHIRKICLQDLKDPMRWESEARWLRRRIEDPRRLKELDGAGTSRSAMEIAIRFACAGLAISLGVVGIARLVRRIRKKRLSSKSPADAGR